MKVGFVYDDGYLIQLQFSFRRSLRNGFPLHGKRSFVGQDFLEKRALKLHGIDSIRFHFHVHPHIRIVITVVGTSVRTIALSWLPHNYYTYNFSCGDILIHD